MAPTHAVLLGDCQSSGRVLKPSEEESHIWSHSPNQLWQAETLIRGWWFGVAVANTFWGVPSGHALYYWQMYYIVNMTHRVQFAFQMTWFLRMWRLHGFSSEGSVLFTSVFTLAFSARLPLTCVNICHYFLVDITCQGMRTCLSKRFPLGLIVLHMVSSTETHQSFHPLLYRRTHTPSKVFAKYFANFCEIFC